jgi:hypothetical protein
MNALVTTRLATLEAIVERGLQTFVEVGNALSEIRDAKLYKLSHGTFEDYCKERWHFTARHARQLIAGAGIAGELAMGSRVPIPTERHARALAPYIAAHGVEAAGALWEEASGDGIPSVAALQAAVDLLVAPCAADDLSAAVDALIALQEEERDAIELRSALSAMRALDPVGADDMCDARAAELTTGATGLLTAATDRAKARIRGAAP